MSKQAFMGYARELYQEDHDYRMQDWGYLNATTHHIHDIKDIVATTDNINELKSKLLAYLENREEFLDSSNKFISAEGYKNEPSS